jgi:predicted nicotinamide N-methyase
MTPARIHNTPPEALGDTVRQSVTIHGREYLYDRPIGLEKLFDHPAVQQAFQADEYIPYWADLWPAASLLAESIIKEPWEARRVGTETIETLELGCGLGLSGIVALQYGLRVTFTDVDAAAVQLAAHNARLNGYHDFETQAVDVRSTPDRQWPVILAADVLYEARMLEPMVNYLKAGLASDGVALIGDADRVSARPFRGMLEEAGFFVIVNIVKLGPPGAQTRGLVYRITWPQE